MIYTKGWQAIPLFWEWVQMALWDGAPIWDGLEEMTPEKLQEAYKWFQPIKEAILSDLQKLQIFLPSGRSVDAHPSLIWGIEGNASRDIDFTIGTIGSGFIREELSTQEASAVRLALERRYGILLGCPLMVNKEEAEKVFEARLPWFPGGLTWESVSPRRMQEALRVGQPARSRGHPKLYDGLIERMVKREFGPRVAPGGDRFGVKKISVRSDAMAWLEKLTGETFPESTIRDYLRPLFPPDAGDDDK
jgi:hypothetical protein